MANYLVELLDVNLTPPSSSCGMKSGIIGGSGAKWQNNTHSNKIITLVEPILSDGWIRLIKGSVHAIFDTGKVMLCTTNLGDAMWILAATLSVWIQ
ncbi:hypothetical protein IFM89_019060 [Coptis chinensis]|uniref:Uncharacterized protein n=1 Tax=Coptis chinensis TaxID=261450 RepID=A0A835IWI9_9MAGN|nr:hypothetical protein IFM89_019060 [Coptis chinensis]